MPQDPQILRPKTGVRVLCVVIYVAGVALLSFHLPFGISDHHRVWIVPVYALFGALWLADLFTTRIVLARDSIRIVSISDFQSRTVPRVEIESVTWEKGCGASIRLRDGKWVRLPSVGRDAQGLTNTIRAWLKRTEILL
jgi:hypothetical protein